MELLLYIKGEFMSKELTRRMRKKPEFIQGLLDMLDYIDENSKFDLSRAVMIEIGSYLGESSEIFAGKVSTLYCIDPWKSGYDPSDYASWKYDLEEVYATYKKRMNRFNNVTTIRETSKEANTKMKDQFDIVYIDGNHQPKYVKEDLEMWTPLVSNLGWICGHDYGHKDYPELQEVVDTFCKGKPDMVFKDTSWCIKKEHI